MTQYKHEIHRKLIHLSSLWMVVAIWFLQRDEALWLFAYVGIFIFIAEFSRKHFPRYNKIYERIFCNILREHESKGALSGAFYVLLAAFLSVALFPQNIAMISLAVMLLADTAASLIGRKYGKHKFLDKSIEGSIAFFITSMIVIFTFNPTINDLPAVALASLAATSVELFSKKLRLDDNLTIPLTVGTIMRLFTI